MLLGYLRCFSSLCMESARYGLWMKIGEFWLFLVVAIVLDIIKHFLEFRCHVLNDLGECRSGRED